MKVIEEYFEEIKDSMDSEVINDFLIELVDKPDSKNLRFLKYFLENRTPDLFDKIKINIIYLLGQIGSVDILDDNYQAFLLNEYYKSDRWIRYEILKSFELISNNNVISKNIIQILEYSLLDDYIPVKISSLSLLLKFKALPRKIVKSLLHIQNFSESNVIDIYSKVLRKFYKDETQVFELLNFDNIYKTLNKNTLRTLLLIFFKSLLNLESFRELIVNSEWDIHDKEIFLKEIYTFEKILLRNIY